MAGSIEELKRETYARAVKQGIAKESFDKLLKNVARPLASAMKPVMQKFHPQIDFLDPVVESGLEMATLNAVAEVMQAMGPVASKIPGLDLAEDDAEEKMDALARAMRGYSGERLGDQGTRFMVMFLPFAKDILANNAFASMFSSPVEEVRSLGPGQDKKSVEDLMKEEGIDID